MGRRKRNREKGSESFSGMEGMGLLMEERGNRGCAEERRDGRKEEEMKEVWKKHVEGSGRREMGWRMWKRRKETKEKKEGERKKWRNGKKK